MSLPPAEQLLASAVQYLIQGEENDAALLLLFCDVAYTSDSTDGRISLQLSGPRVVYDALEMNGWEGDGWGGNVHPVGKRADVQQAFEAVTPHGAIFSDFTVRVQLVDIDPNWRAELQEIAHGRGVHNQGVEIPGGKIVTWKGNIKLRSESERRIAAALDVPGVFFLPNCLARLDAGNSRVTKESDFLVNRNGKWGVLEVDGPFHPRAAIDHDRDRLFKQHRIRVTELYDWELCYNDAPAVVREFLTLLEQNG
jgi:hypothetical protein